jgi:hypothetical protein
VDLADLSHMRIATIALLVLAATTAHAGNKAGVTMPDTIQVGDKQLTLNGMGLREATWLNIDVYVAGLYLEHVSSDAPAIISSAQTMRLVLHFVRDVDRSDIVKAWNEGFAGNATVKVSAIQAQIDRLDGWMGDCDDGSTLTFTYEPGKGVTVDVGATRKGVIEGADFARSLFSIWLGPKPPTKALRKGLLGSHP